MGRQILIGGINVWLVTMRFGGPAFEIVRIMCPIALCGRFVSMTSAHARMRDSRTIKGT